MARLDAAFEAMKANLPVTPPHVAVSADGVVLDHPINPSATDLTGATRAVQEGLRIDANTGSNLNADRHGIEARIDNGWWWEENCLYALFDDDDHASDHVVGRKHRSMPLGEPGSAIWTGSRAWLSRKSRIWAANGRVQQSGSLQFSRSEKTGCRGSSTAEARPSGGTKIGSATLATRSGMILPKVVEHGALG